MRNLILGAFGDARKLVDASVDGAMAANKPSDMEQVERYVKLHRGNPLSMATFVLERKPAGVNPLSAMRDYEAAMEQKARHYGMVNDA